jgi:PAS domain S-box-containing protein
MKIDLPSEKVSSRERYLEAIVQSAIDYAIISMDLDGLVTSWNEGARKILGWAADEMIGRPATAFFTSEDREKGVPQTEMTAALQKGRGSDERWHLRADGTTFWASGEMMALREEDKVIGFIKILRDRTQERELADRQRLLMHELAHRMKNTLSVVQSIVTQSMRNALSLDDAREKLQSRISAYSKAHDVLLQKEWLSATLDQIVDATRSAIGWEASDRIRSHGPRVVLGPEAALTFSLVFHELLTNACKYGGLSNEQGHVEISWLVERQEDEEHAIVTWREVDGPPVGPPTRTGFGSRLIASSLKAYGNVVVSYEHKGLTARMDLPLSRLQFRTELPSAS